MCNARRLTSFARVYSLTEASVFSSDPAGRSVAQAAHAAANSSSRDSSMTIYTVDRAGEAFSQGGPRGVTWNAVYVTMKPFLGGSSHARDDWLYCHPGSCHCCCWVLASC